MAAYVENGERNISSHEAQFGDSLEIHTDYPQMFESNLFFFWKNCRFQYVSTSLNFPAHGFLPFSEPGDSGCNEIMVIKKKLCF